MSEILQIHRGVSRVDDITNLQYHTYTPQTFNFNNNDEIRITIQSQDLYVLPSDSYILIEFRPIVTLTDKSGKPTFSPYSALNFFNEMRYELNGIEIDRCRSPAITTQLKHMLACKTSAHTSIYTLSWLAEKGVAQSTYRFMIPLKLMFGFCEDYNKVVANSRHELILNRSHTDKNVYIADAECVKFVITKIHWKMPIVTMSDQAKMNMLKTIERKQPIPLAFRSWELYELPNVLQVQRNIWSVKTATQITKPRYVVVAFQTNRNHNIQMDPQSFDHCNVSNIRLYLNNERYPHDDMNLNFRTEEYCELVSRMDQIQVGYYNGTQLKNPLSILSLVKDQNVIFFPFDCSRSESPNIGSGMVDIRIEVDAHENFPANTTAYCLIIHDNFVQYTPATGIVQRIIA